MSLLNLIGISNALADTPVVTTPHPREGGLLSILPMLILFIIIFYFFMIRPQSKRAKEQKELLDSLSVGDEVVTVGGVVGRVAKLRDNFIVLTTAKNVEMVVQKNAISSILPKGTLDNLEG